MVLTAACGAKETANISSGHDSHAPASAVDLKSGAKWKTDAPLRKAMSEIKAVIAPIQAGTRNSQNGIEASSKIQAQIEYMFANCKLDADADAALHAIVAQMISAAQKLETPNSFEQGISEINAALVQYETQFEPS